MMLVQACLRAGKDLESNFHHCETPVKHTQACLRDRIDLESSFDHPGGPVKLVQACMFMCMKGLTKRF